jgi:hypothetical protein
MLVNVIFRNHSDDTVTLCIRNCRDDVFAVAYVLNTSSQVKAFMVRDSDGIVNDHKYYGFGPMNKWVMDFSLIPQEV